MEREAVSRILATDGTALFPAVGDLLRIDNMRAWRPLTYDEEQELTFPSCLDVLQHPKISSEILQVMGEVAVLFADVERPVPPSYLLQQRKNDNHRTSNALYYLSSGYTVEGTIVPVSSARAYKPPVLYKIRQGHSHAPRFYEPSAAFRHMLKQGPLPVLDEARKRLQKRGILPKD